MSDRRPIGYTLTRYWCRACAPETARDSWDPMRVGDDHGVPYHCDDCGEPLLPCDHEWEDWIPAYTPEGQPPRELRFCATCGDAEYRPAAFDDAGHPSPAPMSKDRTSTSDGEISA